MTRPLEGLKVLDFSTLLPGPYATMLIADMGADVLRIESPSRPDLVRLMEPQIGGQSAAFEYLNRGKRSLAMNLKKPQSLEVIHALLADHDIVVEQFRPGVMSRLGLGYEQLCKINPRIIYCSITGYGQSGPYRDRAGHDINYLALSGIAASSGKKSIGPLLSGVQIADVAAGSQPAVMAILAAVIQRSRTGKGQHIDIAMSDQCMALQPLMMPSVINGQAPINAEEHFLNGAGLYDYYATADNRYMAVGSLEPQFRKVLVQALGHPEWMDSDDVFLKEHLSEAFAQETQACWSERFADLDACVEPVLAMDEALVHPHAVARELMSESPSGVKQVKPTPSLAGMSNRSVESAPLCGQNNQETLLSLGYTSEQIEAFGAEGLFI
ncbi:CaiB/BaiF CoA transferase family protein [Neptunomonas japonica]|uniref:CoA transferase n=1 Tax=Neptunomonas japonica JAMM 1380 TaxID=1441457 RepID=A0A7R6P9H8_9GAMM|nr:CaiB/BaiF CoA-transferase family protein [Neptunomonas japonica]BBB29734.1 CoA transferase [Neptunomonas japonica JAMM 1380]